MIKSSIKRVVLKVVSVILVFVLLVQAQPLHGFVPAQAFVFPMTTLDSLAIV